ncbi:UDP-N-acetylglucosamine 1-carboxyvinyltransferase [Candidatus Marithioploca araucensis]|uniref:UDP-N-acetylglucosamine 1-carboxyvinyltransferase n=1 Tax=Candidatus Marithioploca araucensis TaxID=70273 RepID=A0ABT7VUE5_9GAMM|nr:UDP-N-acetylglucosamine 1-carboxyvinyltransferase [Candidatus Marithioploca araucensis]
MPAALLSDGICYIENLPLIEDVFVLKEMMETLGAKVDIENNTMIIDPTNVNIWKTPSNLVRKMRASYYLIGALLGRFGKAEVAFPGGCDIGTRPMDQHMKGLRALGANIELEHGIYICEAEHLHGCEVYMDKVSVGATINIMLAAAKADGLTTIVNAAREPHIVDLANFLSLMGAKVKGAGTATIRIQGAKSLHGCRYSILPDQIETGTWMAIAAATDGDITIRGCVPYHMEAVSAKLMEMGVSVIEGDDYLRVIGNGRPRAAHIQTLPYPGFPTDLQQPFTVLLSIADGTSMVVETIFETRFRHSDELMRMGAQMQINGEIAIITGVDSLSGAEVSATDLRAGAALIVAGVMADGVTTINNTRFIDRGYERIDEKLRSLGADVTRCKA